MGKELTIISLYPKISRVSGDVWTLNDWYTRDYLSGMKFDRIFQLHWDEADLQNGDERRYSGDYKEECRKSGAEIVSLGKLEGLETTFLDIDRLKEEFDEKDLTNSVAIMLAVAIQEGYETIRLTGCHLLGHEYVYCIEGILNLINIARGKGITVIADFEQQWIENLSSIDWDKEKFAKVAYWERQ